ncbi:MAG: peptide chain release factor N(5)-glutamine methyltransferase [Kiloniellales bacterium]
MKGAPAVMVTVAGALRDAAGTLGAAGVERPRLDARLLLAHALGIHPERLIGQPDAAVPATAVERIHELTARRARRQPVARVVGRREFWSLTFKVTPDTLDPRPDSETVVETALAVLSWAGVARDRSLRLLDLGTGSGCLLLALLHELPNASGLGVDIDPEACRAAAANAEQLGLGARASFFTGDWGRGLVGAFDLIVAKPPYIPDAEIDGLEPEVALWEPRRALVGGRDGLDCYRALAPHVARLLAYDGVAVVELGAGQVDPVSALMAGVGLVRRAVARDLGGIERCVVLAHRAPGRK